MKNAIITGVTGQTGSYLAELLLEKGYKVYGLRRRSSVFNTERVDHLIGDSNRFELVYGDMADYASIANLISDTKPELVFNTASQSHVRVSFEIPEYTMDVGATGVIRCLEAIRKHSSGTRFIQSSSSEIWGNSPPPQNENTKLNPRSPYAVAKAAGYLATINYREAYKLFTCNSISNNHESIRRGETFVTRKITRAATRIKLGLQNELFLGNLDAKRDWSHAKDVARAQIMILEHDKPDDFVICSGESHSVKEFLEIVFKKLDLEIDKYVKFDPRYLRPTEVDHLQGDCSKIQNTLGWKPEYNFEQLIDEMIEHDLELARKEKKLKE
ncbi:MAG: GDP-mannose 4,6-dehydratase [Candidatus Thorarchaeota archaeon]